MANRPYLATGPAGSASTPVESDSKAHRRIMKAFDEGRMLCAECNVTIHDRLDATLSVRRGKAGASPITKCKHKGACLAEETMEQIAFGRAGNPRIPIPLARRQRINAAFRANTVLCGECGATVKDLFEAQKKVGAGFPRTIKGCRSKTDCEAEAAWSLVLNDGKPGRSLSEVGGVAAPKGYEPDHCPYCDVPPTLVMRFWERGLTCHVACTRTPTCSGKPKTEQFEADGKGPEVKKRLERQALVAWNELVSDICHERFDRALEANPTTCEECGVSMRQAVDDAMDHRENGLSGNATLIPKSCKHVEACKSAQALMNVVDGKALDDPRRGNKEP